MASGQPPGRMQRLRYAFGGALPEHREWVRHDLTDAGWRGRGVLRVLVQLVPVMVVGAVLPGPWWLRVVAPLFVVVCSVFTVAAYGEQLRNRRLRQHGFTPPPPRDDAPPPYRY